MKWFYLIFFVLLILSCTPNEGINPLQKILNEAPSVVQKVIDNKDDYDVQIRYTQIDRDSFNRPTFTSFEFNVDSNRYFYPASTVKMPIAFLAMEYINSIKQSLDLNLIDQWTSIEIDSLRALQSTVTQDSTSENGSASVAHYVKKIFAVSDNDAYNRLFEIMGREYINEQLAKKGFDGVNINHRLSLFGIDNRYTPSWKMIEVGSDTNPKQEVVFRQTEQFDDRDRPNLMDNLIKGKGYVDIDDRLVKEPFDFTHKNAFSIQSMEEVLKSVLFPEYAPRTALFNLEPADYRYLYQCMSTLPRESIYPKYDQWDSYVKFFMFGDEKSKIPEHIRIFNKVGDAYGYLTDCAYVVDFKNRVEFLLTATISVNQNQIYNDGVYEYEEIGFPYMAALGQAVYEYELQREREFLPRFTKFSNIQYE